MNDIQNVIHEKLNSNKYGNLLLHYAAILLYISIGHKILELLPMPLAINMILLYTSRIVYFGYIAGLIGCFAKKEFLPITIMFMLKALGSLLSFISGFSFSGTVNILVYGALGYWAFTCFTKSGNNVADVENKKFCANCGQEVSADIPFCGNCGSKLD